MMIEVRGHRIIPYLPGGFAANIEEFNSARADGFNIIPWEGFSELDLEDLARYENLKVLIFQGDASTNLSSLESLNLEELTLGRTNFTLDFSKFPKLQRLAIDWRSGVFKKNENLSNLVSLHIWKYGSASNDLSDFPFFANLRDLMLVESKIERLDGLSRFRFLESVEFAYMKKLSKLGEMGLPELETFVADTCKKNLSDHEKLGTCPKLSALKLHNCGQIKSLSFLRNLRNLNSFRFVGTDIIDGDLSPLLNISDVFFNDKQHYSHKLKDIRP